jgi:DNA-binding MarR family transcriptional regulator
MIRRQADANTYMSQLNKITGTNNWILQYLEDRDGEDVYQKDIEEKFSVTRSTVSKVLKGMEAKGLLFRENVSNDARLKILKMTDEGRRICHLAAIERDAIDNRMIDGLTDDELDTLEILLKKVACNLAEK